MTNPRLAITATCKENPQCLFKGEDVFMDIKITNTQKVSVEFPFDYIQKTGPTIRLIDTRTKKETYLRKNLADFDLKERFTLIKPGESIILEWVISPYELQQFGLEHVDVIAEITVMASIRTQGETVEFRDTAMLRIVSY